MPLIEQILFRYNCACGRSYQLVARIIGDQLDIYDRERPARLWARCRKCGKRFPKDTPTELKEALAACS